MTKSESGIQINFIYMDEIAIMDNTRSFFPTAGTRTHWKTRDGRSIHVNDLALPHLANIMIQLWDMASKEILKNASKYSTGNLQVATCHYLQDNCFTYDKLYERAFNTCLIDIIGIPTDKCSRVAGQNEATFPQSNPITKAEMKQRGFTFMTSTEISEVVDQMIRKHDRTK